MIVEVAVTARGSRNGLVGAGDVLCIRPYPWDWGLEEIRRYLILLVDARGQTRIEPLFRDIPTGKILTLSELGMLPLTNTDHGRYRLIAKSSLKINFAVVRRHIPDLDIQKAGNRKSIYQPAKKRSQLIRKFDGRAGNCKVREIDVDASSVVAGAEEEFIIRDRILTDKRDGIKKASQSLQHQYLR